MQLDLVWAIDLARRPAVVGPLGDVHVAIQVVELARRVVGSVRPPIVVPDEPDKYDILMKYIGT